MLKAGAETDKKDVDGFLAMDLSPDAQVSYGISAPRFPNSETGSQVHTTKCRAGGHRFISREIVLRILAFKGLIHYVHNNQ